MGRIRIERVSDMPKHGYFLRVRCRCGNNNTLDPAKLIKKGGKVDLATTLDDLYDILRCRICKQRPWDVHMTLKLEK